MRCAPKQREVVSVACHSYRQVRKDAWRIDEQCHEALDSVAYSRDLKNVQSTFAAQNRPRSDIRVNRPERGAAFREAELRSVNRQRSAFRKK